MTSTISVLPDHVANQIAAGEVVQRPASIVKELLENSIDAGAKKITLSITGAGKTAIIVTDDGKGMGEKDAELCFRRHATSKISSAEDLFNLHTRGFRGEAMASIAAVSHVVLKTNEDENELGSMLKLEDGKVISRTPYPGPQGTIVEVKNLFYNVPARRKFLKNDRVELRHCIDEFHRVALVHNDIEWLFKSDEKVLFHLQPTTLRKRVSDVFGRKFNERLVPIEEKTEVVSVNGFVLKPEFAKKKRGEQFFFVNGRFIKSPFLHNALKEAFEEVLSADHHPGYFLYLEVDPQTIDVNIHPTKTEVKFEDERSIYAVLRSAARHAIGQFNVAPAIDFNSEVSLSVPPLPKGHIPQRPQIKVNPNFNPFESTKPSTPRLRTDDQRYERIKNEKMLNDRSELEIPALQQELDEFWNAESEINDGVQNGLTGGKNTLVMPWGKYMVTILGERMLFIDLQAARFRILFDQLWKKLQDATLASQQLLFPATLELSLSEKALVEEHAHHFAVAGFDWHFEDGSEHMEITGVPMDLTPEQAVPAVEKIIDELQELEELADAAFLKTLAMGIAHHASKSALPRAEEELVALREQLLSSSNPQFTPKGKKIIAELSQQDLVNLL